MSQTFQTDHGVVTVKPRHYNFLMNAFVVELKLTPPSLWGWGVTATFPEEVEGKVDQAFANKWATEAIGKLV
ncbi:hypothetical protein PTW35_06820 [Photobacterium sp. DA100]|uniref:hypothetical protein n=1 Tax=Photobacterium sp. DA100 TaxID=3027472 RepID=UPI00247990FE|nr:hypothetical protein [Photobacterium sp. DA100]WEM43498.1 hypothetical protein PTW35_06820 [Photobacterium sp. DA100]